MAIAITEEHQELARVARSFLDSHQARAASRELLEAPEEKLPSFWKEMAALTPTWAREVEAIQGLGTGLERYRELAVPTLLLLGTATSDHVRAAATALEAALPDARTAPLEGQAHLANLTAPQLVADAVAEFLLGS